MAAGGGGVGARGARGAAPAQDQDRLHARSGIAVRRDDLAPAARGMCVARLNFSHGSHEYHQETLDNLRAAMELTGILCAVMLDTKTLLPKKASGKDKAKIGSISPKF